MQTLLRVFDRFSWIQRLLILVPGCNIVLIVWGAYFIPTTLATSNGIVTLLAPVGVQVVVALFALVGPLSLRREHRSYGISLLFGALFAVAYDGIVFLDMVGISWDFNVWLLFLSVAGLAGLIVGYRTGQIGQGVMAAIWSLVIGTTIWSMFILLINYAFWGTHAWYLFWLSDGAVDEFRHSGSNNVNVFLLQDIQGALVFHQVLSVALGGICGLVAGGLAKGFRWLGIVLGGRGTVN